MKKITFILFALIAGTSFAQTSAEGSAEVIAVLVSPISITSNGVLNFGNIASPGEGGGGDVTVAPAGGRTIPSTMEVASTPGDISVPTFTVTREANTIYGIATKTTNLSLEGETDNPIILKDIVTNLGTFSGLTAEEFTVGGTLQINDNQPTGDYKGQVSITVSYE